MFLNTQEKVSKYSKPGERTKYMGKDYPKPRNSPRCILGKKQLPDIYINTEVNLGFQNAYKDGHYYRLGLSVLLLCTTSDVLWAYIENVCLMCNYWYSVYWSRRGVLCL
jgi:hypothetical protein